MRLYKINGHTQEQETGVAANSLVLDDMVFVTKAAGVVSKAVAGGVVSGVNSTRATFAADNETVALGEVTFNGTEINALYEVAITGGTITAADEGNFYDLSDEATVDGATESATTGQVELVEFISATNGVFRIANA